MTVGILVIGGIGRFLIGGGVRLWLGCGFMVDVRLLLMFLGVMGWAWSVIILLLVMIMILIIPNGRCMNVIRLRLNGRMLNVIDDVGLRDPT